MSTIAEAGPGTIAVGVTALLMMGYAWWYESPKQVARRAAKRKGDR